MLALQRLMANNPNLYNAAVAGVTGGNLERWLSTNAADAALAAAVGNVATAVDEAIAPIEGGGSAQQCQLMQSICQGIMSGRSVLGLGGSNYDAISDAIAASWTAVQAVLDPTGPEDWTGQVSWEVDPATGSDSAAGTPAAPLASVGELNRRLKGLTIGQNTTIQLVGNQTEALVLNSVRVADGFALTIQGEATTVATGTISTATALSASTQAPWTLVTTGIDWTATTARRIQISNGASLGAIAWVLSVTDANTVIIGALGLIATNTITPTNGMTFNVQTLNTMPNPIVQCLTGGQLPATFQSLIIRDLSFTYANGFGAAQFLAGARMAAFGCQFALPSQAFLTSAADSMVFRQCKFAGAALSNYDINCIGLMTFIGCVFNNGTFSAKGGFGGLMTHILCAFDGCVLAVFTLVRASAAQWYQNVNVGSSSGAIFVNAGALYKAFASNSFVAGAGITGAGICVESGGQYQYHPSAKPTISGSISDTRVGGTIQAYAAIPFIEPANNAMLVEIDN